MKRFFPINRKQGRDDEQQGTEREKTTSSLLCYVSHVDVNYFLSLPVANTIFPM